MKKGYPYIDIMRIVASLFVIAIHIAPFFQINPALDTFITRVIGRLAVPFFFITTSFFLFKDGYPSKQRISKTIFHLLKWYVFAIIIYIPLMIYNGYFIQDHLFFEMIKDLLTDGTFYHLWYFPAVIIGLVIVCIITKYLPKYSFVIVSLLYIIGLCGDSYYGLISQVKFIDYIFNNLFQFMDYTRNGFFFAPMFLMLGVILASEKKNFKNNMSFIFLVFCLSLMIVEASFLHKLSFIKHDSMYLFLPFVSYFLFSLLKSYRGERYIYYKDISLWVYLIHPLMIVVVRMIGKGVSCMPLVENNLIQFLCVTLYSFVFAYGVHWLMRKKNYERTSV